MRLIPVLDVLDGVVVHGVRGARELYKPIVSTLCATVDPVAVARSFQDRFGFKEFYVADLNGLLHQQPDRNTIERLSGEGHRLLLDDGCPFDSFPTPRQDQDSVRKVIALETNPSVASIRPIVIEDQSAAPIFSVDLMAGEPIGHLTVESGAISDVGSICNEVVAAGIRSLIVLDLASVGNADGGTTIELCQRLRHRWTDIEIITGGGVRNIDDILRYEAAGIDGLLVSSALHDGSLNPTNLQPWLK